eukprot:1516339-Pleurochrysis_carterae.AAC.1
MSLHVLSYLPTFLCPRRVYVWATSKLLDKRSAKLFARQNGCDVTQCDFHLNFACYACLPCSALVLVCMVPILILSRRPTYACAQDRVPSRDRATEHTPKSHNSLRDVLCVLSDSEEDVQGLDSWILRQPDWQIFTDFGSSPAERHRVKQRLTREVTESMLLLASAQYEVTEKPAAQPIEFNPACTEPTPLQVDEPEGHDQPTGENGSIGVTFTKGAEPQPLFAQPLSGCMKAVIPLRASFANFGYGADVSVTAVVDSGLAHTALTESVFRQIGGGALEPSRLAFTGIGGERLTCLGRAPLGFALGDVWLRTAVYVSDKLVEPMLLGASSIVEHGLVVD